MSEPNADARGHDEPWIDAVLAYEAGGPLDLEAATDTDDHGRRHREAAFAAVDALREAFGTPGQTPRPHSPTPSSGSEPIGDFRILREIGRGGMGVVYEAEQLSLGRRVALKVLPFSALAGQKARNRFHNEVRAAALLDHHNIVSVYSVGEDKGVHYFAMRLIHGRSLAELIGETRRDLAARGSALIPLQAGAPEDESRVVETEQAEQPTVRDQQAGVKTRVNSRSGAERYRAAARMAIEAADALQHAHEQGVLHRDIKPGNLLVDGDGRVYVTDFGLARIEADTGMTMTGDIVGTLRYMAPEQALPEQGVVDHRADIYSLGATLYELLALQAHFGDTDRNTLLQRLAHEEPLPLRKVVRQIPAALETIVRKAMAKSPSDRYDTAADLADDLRAFLDDRPIKAKPPSWLDRGAKWVRRRRGLVAAAVLMLATLAIGSVFAATLLMAEQKKTAEAAQQSEAVVEFLVNELLAAPINKVDDGRALTVSEALANAESRIQGAFSDQPLVEATLRMAIARTYNTLREPEKAEVHARRAVKLRTDALGRAHAVTFEAADALTDSLVQQRKTDEALRLSGATLDTAAGTLGPEHTETIKAVNRKVSVLLAFRDRDVAMMDELRQRIPAAVQTSHRVLGDEHRITLTARKHNADLIAQEGDVESAETIWNELLEVSRRTLGFRDRLTISLARAVAGLHDDRNNSLGAARLYEEILQSQVRTLGYRSAETHQTMWLLSNRYNLLRRFEDGQRLAEKGLEIARLLYGEESHWIHSWEKLLVFCIRGQWRLNEAGQLQQKVLERCRDDFGVDHRETLFAMQQLGYDFVLQKRYQEALQILDDTIRIGTERSMSRTKWPLQFAVQTRARALHGLGRVREAILVLESQIEKLRVDIGPIGEELAWHHYYLARWSLEEDQFEEASYHLRAVEQALPSTEFFIRDLVAWRYACSWAPEIHDAERAIALAARSCELTGYENGSILNTLAAAYARQGDFESAVQWGEKAVEHATDQSERARFAMRLDLYKKGEPFTRPRPSSE